MKKPVSRGEMEKWKNGKKKIHKKNGIILLDDLKSDTKLTEEATKTLKSNRFHLQLQHFTVSNKEINK